LRIGSAELQANGIGPSRVFDHRKPFVAYWTHHAAYCAGPMKKPSRRLSCRRANRTHQESFNHQIRCYLRRVEAFGQFRKSFDFEGNCLACKYFVKSSLGIHIGNHGSVSGARLQRLQKSSFAKCREYPRLIWLTAVRACCRCQISLEYSRSLREPLCFPARLKLCPDTKTLVRSHEAWRFVSLCESFMI
jgi:hypothetical protein